VFSCGFGQGQFGWHISSAEELDVLEERLFIVTEYTISRENLYFSSKDIIHYMYRFENSPAAGSEFVVTLEKESLGFVEIELKKKIIEKDAKFINDKYLHLEPGNYRVNVVYEEEIIDTVLFTVLPDDGYNYRSSTLTELEESEDESDEIIKYSK
jgi:hypothetical protein